MHLYVPAFLATVLLVVLAWAAVGRKIAVKAQLPPGPPADPLIGHVRIVPTQKPEVAYAEWAKEYRMYLFPYYSNSDVIYVNVLGQPIVVLHSAEAAIDLMDKRSSIYSERPSFHFFEESGWIDALTFMSTGPRFRKHRKLIQNAFSASNCIPYRPRQEKLAQILVRDIIEKSTDWERLLVRFATSITLGMGYGIQITGDDDPMIGLADKVAWIFANGGAPCTTLVDVLPIVRRLPRWVRFIPSLKFARDSYPIIREFIERPFNKVKQDMAQDTAPLSFVNTVLSEMQDENRDQSNTADITEADICGAASIIYVAGTDTTFNTAAVFVLCMVRNPEVQKRGQLEIDTVVGRDRLPKIDDRPSLPFIDRIFYETARWYSVVPLGVPHRSNKDDVYKNMLIPKGSLIMANAYAMFHDPSVYADPDDFNPDRYLPSSEGGRGEPIPVGLFGFGRRVCPGQNLGSASVWIAIVTMLATLKLSKALDREGNEITPNPKMTSGLESHPEHFPCVIEPRDERAVRLVREAMNP